MDKNALIKDLYGGLMLERDAELEEDSILRSNLSHSALERAGHAFQKLVLGSIKLGLIGRTTVRLELPPTLGKDRRLPPNKFSSGDIVMVRFMARNSSSDSGDAEYNGVVRRITDSFIQVVFDTKDPPDVEIGESNIFVTRLPNEITHKRQIAALDELEKRERAGVNWPDNRIRRVLMDGVKPDIKNKKHNMWDWKPLNDGLNPSQIGAVDASFPQGDENPVFLIWGPPATGKSETVVEVVKQAVLRGEKVLMCAPSNIAVDNLIEKLVETKEGKSLVRLGHPARMLPSVVKSCLDARVKSSDVLADLRYDIKKALQSWPKRDKRNEYETKQEYFDAIHAVKDELRQLRKELREREGSEIERVLSDAKIVACTLAGAGELDFWAKKQKKRDPDATNDWVSFDLVVIDEACQATEPLCWIAAMHGKRLGLAGDPLQLPPTLRHPKAQKGQLGHTLFERAMELGVEKHLLNTQYRMNRLIMDYSGKRLYDGKLVAHESVANHLLCDLDGVDETEDTSTALLYIDTDDCNMFESQADLNVLSSSIMNVGEAELVKLHVIALLQAGVRPDCIGVISPYQAQISLLRGKVLSIDADTSGIEVQTVDGFQGREKEAIIVSLVRSNPDKNVGFLSEKRRINVSITRARRHLAVISDRRTIAHEKVFIRGLVDHLDDHGLVKSAIEFDGISVEQFSSSGKGFTGSEVSKGKEKGSGDGKGKSKSKNKSKLTVFPSGPQSSGSKTRRALARIDAHTTTHPLPSIEKVDGGEHRSSTDSSARMVPPSSVSVSASVKGEGAGKGKGKGKERVFDIEEELARETGMAIGSVSDDEGEDEKEEKEEKEEVSTTPSTKKRKNRKKKKKKKSEAEAEAEGGEDWDELLRQSKACNHCDKAAGILGVICKYCRKLYCLADSQPEVHGCGAEAARQAKNAFRATAYNYGIGMDPTKSHTHSKPKPMLSAGAHAFVERQLHKKLQEKQEMRKPVLGDEERGRGSGSGSGRGRGRGRGRRR